MTTTEERFSLESICLRYGDPNVLRKRPMGNRGSRKDFEANRVKRRKIMADSFRLGYSIEEISEFLGAHPVSIVHNLRMHCHERFGSPYNIKESEIWDVFAGTYGKDPEPSNEEHH